MTDSTLDPARKSQLNATMSAHRGLARQAHIHSMMLVLHGKHWTSGYQITPP
jgi:hypothetical protein